MSSTTSEVVQAPQEPKPELIVIFKTTPVAKVTGRGLVASSEDVSSVNEVLTRHNASLKLLFGQDEARLQAQQAEVVAAAATIAPALYGAGAGDDEQHEADIVAPAALAAAALPDLSSFYTLDGEVEDPEALAAELLQQELVDAAYVTPPAAAPLFLNVEREDGDPPTDSEAPPVTPNFKSRQGFLGAAPGGIEALWAHTQPGGKGDGIRIADVEWGWRFTHEDLRQQLGGLLAGTNSTDTAFVNHGTAVAGVVGGDENAIGVLGIAPNAIFYASSLVNQSTSAAIKAAADRLRAGDVILLEVHRSGPQAPSPPQDQKGYIAIEWWPQDLAAIQYAVAKGIVVVEAAGNGSVNLNDPIYDRPQAGWPSWWRNPFRTTNPTSGAVIVGAGAPPPGTHGRNWGPDRSRLDFSNHGLRVDAQGWGREVTTTGYGTLQGGVSQDIWYTDTFNGTSSASPMVTGAVLCAQGTRRARGKRLLTSHEFRSLLRTTGSPQQASPDAPVSQRIGNRPNLRQLIPAALARP